VSGHSELSCRAECGACCIAPSISPSLPALPLGKAAGVRCPHLGITQTCALFGMASRPATCIGLQPGIEMCGNSQAEALATLERWEIATAPAIK